MSPVHFHLLLNHLPVLGAIFGTTLLVLSFFLEGSQLARVALGTLAVAALFSVPTYLTGDPAAETVVGLPGVTGAVIEPHEEMATLSFIVIVVLGIAALAGLLLFAWRERLPVWFLGSILGLSVVVSGMMAWTAYLGGEIRHTEIRPGEQVATAAGGENPIPSSGKEVVV